MEDQKLLEENIQESFLTIMDNNFEGHIYFNVFSI